MSAAVGTVPLPPKPDPLGRVDLPPRPRPDGTVPLRRGPGWSIPWWRWRGLWSQRLFVDSPPAPEYDIPEGRPPTGPAVPQSPSGSPGTRQFRMPLLVPGLLGARLDIPEGRPPTGPAVPQSPSGSPGTRQFRLPEIEPPPPPEDPPVVDPPPPPPPPPPPVEYEIGSFEAALREVSSWTTYWRGVPGQPQHVIAYQFRGSGSVTGTGFLAVLAAVWRSEIADPGRAAPGITWASFVYWCFDSVYG